jgi:hypothetical protein
MRNLFAAVAVLLLVGCLSRGISPEGSAVRVTRSAAIVASCKALGEVKAVDHRAGGLFAQGVSKDNSTKTGQEQTAKLGGNVLLIDQQDSGMMGSTTYGTAYSCASAPG